MQQKIGRKRRRPKSYNVYLFISDSQISAEVIVLSEQSKDTTPYGQLDQSFFVSFLIHFFEAALNIIKLFGGRVGGCIAQR